MARAYPSQTDGNPRVPAAEGPNPLPKPETTATVPEKTSVLVVDDDPVSRLLLRMLLRRLPGCEVREAENGRAAREALNRGPLPDLCILDLTMPEVDGFQFLEQIRQDSRLQALEVVVCTATADRDTIRKAASLRVASYLIKPFDPPKLIRDVQEVLARLSKKRRIEMELVRERLGVDAFECEVIVEELLAEIREAVKALRSYLAMRNFYSARIRVSALVGACSMLPVGGVLTMVRAVEQDLLKEDLAAAVRSVEALENFVKNGRKSLV